MIYGFTKSAIADLIELLKKWQKVEEVSIKNSTEILSKIEVSLIQIVMEIIRQDSAMHRRVQQVIIEHFTKEPIVFHYENMAHIWELIDKHNELEKETIVLAKKSNGSSKFTDYTIFG